MKKYLIGAAFAASAMVAAAPAEAASVVSCGSGVSCSINLIDGNTTISFSGSIDAGQVTKSPFIDIYGFNLGVGTVTVSVTTANTGVSNDIDFSQIRLDGPGANDSNLTQVIFDGGGAETFQLNSFGTTGGAYTLTLNGAGGSGAFVSGSYGGSISFTPTPAVPEPATWAMMIGGFGLVGGAMRRGRKTKVVTA